ncbi:MAG TPA: 2-oxoacid:ferredoxin oxidoreductase subunit gamma [Chloroflexi bacterium]|nr:2-oxoacid:ferredoxin oxidoreductase subunit gamma [Chloroflexota bacterium]
MKNTGNLSQKNSRYEIRIAGSGGQGIVLAGIILAEAAILDGKYVTQSQNYGAEARGGNSISDVIISDMEVDYPQAVEMDLLVALTQEACTRNLPAMKEGGIVIVDSTRVRFVPWYYKVARLPFERIAQKLGEERAINMAALGAIASLCPIVSPHSLVTAMAKRLPSAKIEVNHLAFEEALQAAEKLKQSLTYVETKDEFEI